MVTNARMAEIIARARARVDAEKAAKPVSTTNSIIYNEEQSKFISLATSGADCVLIGAAGTGKTTTMKGTISALLTQDRVVPTLTYAHKHLPVGAPGIIATSYTNRSVMNLKKAMPANMVDNCITIHKLLEYQPNFYEVLDPISGEYKKKVEFIPTRNQDNPLDPAISTIIIDEASTVSVELFKLLCNALSHPVQFIFLGDIQQLPPVFGSAILGFKGVELAGNVVELVQVYRQALESPIIKGAHRILSGVPIPPEEFPEWNEIGNGKLILHPWKKKISADNALLTIAAFFKRAYDTNAYDPEQDIILIPFNKACGTIELNKYIANHIARTSGRQTFEIIAGFNKHYLSVGDIVMFDKADAVVTKITHNGSYKGRKPRRESIHLDYWGHVPRELDYGVELNDDEFDDFLIQSAGEKESNEASHIVTLVRKSDDAEVELTTAAEVNNLALGYSITVHKSQGSEWRKVFFIVHQSHSTMIQRELLYTAVTRAREELYIICEPDTFQKGILSQKIKGNTLAEKFEVFKGKMGNGELDV